MDISELNSLFGVSGALRLEEGESGLVRIAITAAHSDAQIYLHGAHVTDFQPRGQEPLLFLSRRSFFRPDKAIRGGIPVIFPWFGPRAGDPSAPQHGLARTLPWEVREVKQDSGGAIAVTLTLRPSDVTRQWLANDFEATYTITVGNVLGLALEIHNSSGAPFNFEEALHTYLRVGDVRAARIEGLAGRTFIDKTDGMRRKTQPPGAMQLEAETDRVYLDTPDTITIDDPVLQRRLTIAKSSSGSTIVWNPWSEKAHAMADLAEDEWPKMLCVETGDAADNSITLQPGQRHTMRASIAAGRR